MPRGTYFPYMHRRLEHIFTRAVIRIAYPAAWEEKGQVYSGNRNHILGFIVAEPTKEPSVGLVVHYVYTRRDYSISGGDIHACYRRQGVARKLVESMLRDYKQERITFTIWGQELLADDKMFEKVTKEWVHTMSYNPELFMSTMLPYQWERGIVGVADTRLAEGFHKAKAQIPTAF